ncbi:MAG: hypothetical protein CL528_00450 [Aequorivita sp.]|jgi:hypothetical protein|nr:hypothetical protein [Aequorivita sp.]MBP40220.1 hypothetical protein [Aequorivita sp.]|tara:strand:+ start:1141 stop:1620 length:480 start_codon:yes stop_codon:yes gene_type:complete
MLDLNKMENDRFRWSKRTFPDATPISSLRKLESEIKEIEADLNAGTPKPEEYADALMCLLDSAGRAGISLPTIIDAYHTKIQINKKRNWYKNPDNSYSHIKEPVRLDSLEVGEKFKYQPQDVGIFMIIKKQENWIETIRTQSNRKSGDFPWTEVYPLKN